MSGRAARSARPCTSGRLAPTPALAANKLSPTFEQTFKNIDGILHKDAGCTSELDYTEQSSWLLFLKYLDALEIDKAAEAALEGKRHGFIPAEVFVEG